MVELVLSKKEAAEALQVSPRTIQRLVADGKLPKTLIRGAVRIPVDAILKMASAQKPQAAQKPGPQRAHVRAEKKAAQKSTKGSPKRTD